MTLYSFFFSFCSQQPSECVIRTHAIRALVSSLLFSFYLEMVSQSVNMCNLNESFILRFYFSTSTSPPASVLTDGQLWVPGIACPWTLLDGWDQLFSFKKCMAERDESLFDLNEKIEIPMPLIIRLATVCPLAIISH